MVFLLKNPRFTHGLAMKKERQWHKGNYSKKKNKKKLPPVRIELTTPGLQDQCSATEL